MAPVLTMGFLLSVYSTSGCDFVRVELGFDPKPNEAWNSSSASLGFFYGDMPDYDIVEADFDAKFLTDFHEDCHWYPDAFEDNFIDSDRTWKVARIMSMISAGSSLLSSLFAWISLGPFYCPVAALWPTVLLPMVMVAFIAEGSKFLIFDMSICRNKIFEVEEESATEFLEAESCSLGDSATYGIISGILLLVAMLMVCLKVPEERQLDPRYGNPDWKSTANDSDGREDFQRQGPSKNSMSHRSDEIVEARQMSHEQPQFRDEYYKDDELERYGTNPDDEDYKERDEGIAEPIGLSHLDKHPFDAEFYMDHHHEEEDKVTTKSLGIVSLGTSTDAKSLGNSTNPNSLGNSTMTSTENVAPVTDSIKISESRLALVATVEEKAHGSTNSPTAASMLEDLVQDLNDSYQIHSTTTSISSSRRSINS